MIRHCWKKLNYFFLKSEPCYFMIFIILPLRNYYILINICSFSNVYSETNDVNTGLLVEVWRRGFLLDYAIGYHMVSLPTVRYSNEVIDNYRNMNLVSQQLKNNCGSINCVHVITVQLYVHCFETQWNR